METARRLGIQYRRGVYALFQGPYYETRAEIRAIERMGADAVGMSTVPEVIAANHAGMRALGIACITNLATGIAAEKHSHAQVLQKGKRGGAEPSALAESSVGRLEVKRLPCSKRKTQKRKKGETQRRRTS